MSEGKTGEEYLRIGEGQLREHERRTTEAVMAIHDELARLRTELAVLTTLINERHTRALWLMGLWSMSMGVVLSSALQHLWR